MLLDFDSVQSGRSIEVRSFSGLMDLYEQNYLRLRKLAPDLSVADQMISSVAGHTDLYLSVRERCKYTTMLSMTYRFGEPGDYVFEPDLHLRVYHDARVVEVELFHQRKHGWVFNGYSLQHKWVMNRFLYKWFGFCVHQGHFFQPMTHLKY
ncbi:MAG: DUF1249 domain-containing protein [Gammaproteobacteria bacterium]